MAPPACVCVGGGVGTRPRYLIVCLWRRLLASRHCSCVGGGGGLTAEGGQETFKLEQAPWGYCGNGGVHRVWHGTYCHRHYQGRRATSIWQGNWFSGAIGPVAKAAQ